MARRQPKFSGPNVEAIESGVAADPKAPGGEWMVRRGSVWKSSHPVVVAHSEWFVELGEGQTAAPYFPVRIADS